MEQKTKPVIEMIDVTVASLQRPEVPRIENVNWSIMPGDYWLVGGHPGSGKSDLLAVAAGLQRAMTGKVHWFGHDISALDEKELVEGGMKVGLVFENGGRMFRHLTVTENIALPLRYHRNWTAAEAEQHVAEIIKLTGLDAYAHSTAGRMNSAWEQRVGLARALALKPEVLLLDRPMSGQLKWWIGFLKELSAGSPFTGGKPMTLVVVTDDLSPWLDQARQFAVVKKNRWHLSSKEELLSQELWTEF